MKLSVPRNVSILFFLLIFCFAFNLYAQNRNAKFHAYIREHNELAVEHMKKHKIPASITLAQGLLESGAGQSALARKSNNHFGIKCGSAWRGKTVRHTDDAPNECFRVYGSVKESYEDHSLFLKNGARYAFLFQLSITDYKGWARGLKKAGYATDPSYANRLISIIEDYELYKHDQKGKVKSSSTKSSKVFPHQVYLSNDLAYVVARNGDTFKSLAKETGVSARKLIKYNDLHKAYTLVQGDIIYLCKKNTKANKKYTVHVVRDGDSMHSISQMYGIRLKNLYALNVKDGDYVPEVGDMIWLR